MFSATVRAGNREKCWNTIPIPFFLAMFGEEIIVSLLLILIVPDSGFNIPYNIFTRVDFPAPFSPKRAWISPFKMEISISLLAVKLPKFLLILLASKRISNSFVLLIKRPIT